MADKLAAVHSEIAKLQKQLATQRAAEIKTIKERIAALQATPEEIFSPVKRRGRQPGSKNKLADVSATTAVSKSEKTPKPLAKRAATKGNKAVELTPSGRVKKVYPPTHRDPKSGRTWNGMGPKPAWLAGHKKPDTLRI